MLEPGGPLETEDFDRLSALLDPCLAEAGRLRGLMVNTRSFPGWDGFEVLFAHERFVRVHAPLIDRVALVTDSNLVPVFARPASLALSPMIRHFPWDKRHEAMAWLAGG